MMLARVNQNMDEIEGRILEHIPLPSIREVFSKIRVKKSHGMVMSTTNHPLYQVMTHLLCLSKEQKPTTTRKRDHGVISTKNIGIHERHARKYLVSHLVESQPDRKELYNLWLLLRNQISSLNSPFTKEQVEQLLNLLHSNFDNPSCSSVRQVILVPCHLLFVFNLKRLY